MSGDPVELVQRFYDQPSCRKDRRTFREDEARDICPKTRHPNIHSKIHQHIPVRCVQDKWRGHFDRSLEQPARGLGLRDQMIPSPRVHQHSTHTPNSAGGTRRSFRRVSTFTGQAKCAPSSEFLARCGGHPLVMLNPLPRLLFHCEQVAVDRVIIHRSLAESYSERHQVIGMTFDTG